MTLKHIDRNAQASAQRSLCPFVCVVAMRGYPLLDRSEPTPSPGKGSA